MYNAHFCRSGFRVFRSVFFFARDVFPPGNHEIRTDVPRRQQQRQFRVRRPGAATASPQARRPGGREDPKVSGQAQGPGAVDPEGQADIPAGGDPPRDRLHMRPGGHAGEPQVRERGRGPLRRRGRHALVLGAGRRPSALGHHFHSQRAGRRCRGGRPGRATAVLLRTGKSPETVNALMYACSCFVRGYKIAVDFGHRFPPPPPHTQGNQRSRRIIIIPFLCGGLYICSRKIRSNSVP